MHYYRLDAGIPPSSVKLVSLRVILASSLRAVGHEGLHHGGRDIDMLLYIILLYISLLFVARRQSCRTSRATRRGARYTSSPTTRHTHTHTHTHARTHTRTRTHAHTRTRAHTHSRMHARICRRTCARAGMVEGGCADVRGACGRRRASGEPRRDTHNVHRVQCTQCISVYRNVYISHMH